MLFQGNVLKNVPRYCQKFKLKRPYVMTKLKLVNVDRF